MHLSMDLLGRKLLSSLASAGIYCSAENANRLVSKRLHKKAKMNCCCRNSVYPLTMIERQFVPDDLVAWEKPFNDYDPIEYSSASTEYGAQADPTTPSAELHFNALDDHVDRRSCTGEYTVLNGRPLNPAGRTGLAGRGALPRWGPNHRVFLLFTRLNMVEVSYNLLQGDALEFTEFLSVQDESGNWCFPNKSNAELRGNDREESRHRRKQTGKETSCRLCNPPSGECRECLATSSAQSINEWKTAVWNIGKDVTLKGHLFMFRPPVVFQSFIGCADDLEKHCLEILYMFNKSCPPKVDYETDLQVRARLGDNSLFLRLTVNVFADKPGFDVSLDFLQNLKLEMAQKSTNEEAEKIIQKLKKHHVQVARSYYDDPRNTDNAWVEVVAYEFGHRHNIGRFDFESGNNSMHLQWRHLERSPLDYDSFR